MDGGWRTGWRTEVEYWGWRTEVEYWVWRTEMEYWGWKRGGGDAVRVGGVAREWCLGIASSK